ncbi:cell division ATP-binding protein FtsE [uncultured Bifidobacterium sp.]|uniref:cell division ATP-binding protein FtsE n=1 Tax=uncultured Bifidobacterium sp. TaxID=165187 RepID=UPI0028DC0214|nr:cell division ATP-binding protein FtsE [uncultured Bifidobacterium sp.]
MALIALDEVSKVYPRGTRPALERITLHVDRGDFVFLVGASGSGKTTLLSLLLREEEATGGEIHVAGNDLRRLTSRQVPHYRRSLGFVFQDYKLLNNKTVWQNVAFALEVIGANRATIRALVPKVLDTVGLTGKERSYPHELSGGEAQRVAIARAYVNHPQILLADEPTGNLDPTTSLGIMEVLDAINRSGTTIVMATHNEEIVNSMRKRVVELHEGSIVRDERNGSYDSSLYYPDGAAAPTPVSAGVHGVLPATGGVGGDDGIARLATAVHSGRTGRYGQAFQSAETTMTWGRGLVEQTSGSVPTDSDRTDEGTSVGSRVIPVRNDDDAVADAASADTPNAGEPVVSGPSSASSKVRADVPRGDVPHDSVTSAERDQVTDLLVPPAPPSREGSDEDVGAHAPKPADETPREARR